MVKLLASVLKHIITIQTPVFTVDGLEQWQDFAVARAEIKALYDKGNGEVYSAMQLMDNSYYRFTIRHIDNLKTSMRIMFKNRFFLIKRIINLDEQNISTLIIAQETL
jgi:SPP1 family predicted phage head-tail adaptor